MRALLAILLFPLLVQAAGEGMWQASSVGVTLNHVVSRCRQRLFLLDNLLQD